MMKGVEYAHSRGIINRDIKIDNLAIDREAKKLRILDWGIGTYYHPHVPHSITISTRNYRDPEVMVGNMYYDYSLDMWSVGCVFGMTMFQLNEHFFKSETDDGVLLAIA